jgi:hypothetical protein
VDLEPLELITEETLREVIGSEMIDRAYMDLASGKVIERTHFPGDQIYARWDFTSNSPEMRLGFQDDMLLTLCTCRAFHQDGMCAHLAGLMVAWASQQSSFVPVFVESEEGEPGEPRARQRAQAPSKPAPGGQSFDVVDNFRQILNRFTVSELRDIAKRRSVVISGIRKEPIVDSLAQAFSQKEKFRQDWQLLSAPARRVAGLMPFLIHYCNTASLEQAAQPLGIKGPAFTQALDELKSSGWIAVESYGEIHYPAVLPVWSPPDASFIDIPQLDVQTLRVQLAAPPETFYQAVTRLLVLTHAAPKGYQARIDVQVREMWKKVPMLRDWPVEMQDLEQAARDPRPYQFIQQHGLRIAPSPSPLTNESRQKLAAAMAAAPDMVDFIIRLLSALKLLVVNSGKPVKAVPGAIVSILQAGAMQQARQMFVGYADLQGWSEIDLSLAHSSDFRLILRNYNQGNYTLFVQNMSVMRERLILLMRRLPPGQWYAVRDMARGAALFPFHTWLRGLAGFGYFEVNGRKLNLDRPEDSQEVLSRLIEGMLSGPLYWQGAVDLAWEKDRAVGFRITDLGSALFVQPNDFEMPQPARDKPALQFTTDGALALRLESASGDLIGLAMQLGEVQVSPQGTVIVHPALLGAGRAFEAGWTADRILETLEAEAGAAAPGALADALRKWWQDFGRVQIYQDVALMEFNDDYALSELLAGTSLSRYLLYRFNPRLIAVRPEGVEELRGEMVKKGYTPKTAA